MSVHSGAWPRQAHTYRLPELLADIRLLDLLELSGSTRQASLLLQISQPSVSRRYRALAEDFGLRPEPAEPRRCRYGSTRTMQALRHSCRCHRLESGVLRLGSDPIHAGLLEGVPWLLPTPLRFRAVDQWLHLVREGVLDGALLSQLELDLEPPELADDLELHPLGPLPLALAWAKPGQGAADAPPPRVLVPPASLAAGLQALLSRQGWALRSVGQGCTTPEQWLLQLRRSDCAMPVGGQRRAKRGWGDGMGWRPLADGAVSPVWLALPIGGACQPLLRHTLERLRCLPMLQRGEA